MIVRVGDDDGSAMGSMGTDDPPLVRRGTGCIAFEIAILDELDAAILDDADIVDEKLSGIEQANLQLMDRSRDRYRRPWRLPRRYRFANWLRALSSLGAQAPALALSASGSRSSRLEPPPSASRCHFPASKYCTSSASVTVRVFQDDEIAAVPKLTGVVADNGGCGMFRRKGCSIFRDDEIAARRECS